MLGDILNALGICGGIIAIVGAAYVALNKAALENYKATVESQNARITALAKDNNDLRERVTKLEGVNDGYALATELFAEAVARSGICAKAWDCEERVIPTIGR